MLWLAPYFLNARISGFVHPETAVFPLVEKGTLMIHFSINLFIVSVISLNRKLFPQPVPVPSVTYTVSLCGMATFKEARSLSMCSEFWARA